MKQRNNVHTFVPALVALVLLAAVPGVSIQAQDTLEEELFGEVMFDDALFDDALSGGEGLVRQADANPGNPSAALLTSETVKVGGRFFMDVEGSGKPDAWGDDISTYLSPGVALGFDLYLDARPDEDLRVFIKGRAEYPFADDGDYELMEAFADILPFPGLFVRSGKQTANWGVGYFFSPANLLNTQRVNPEDPEAELTGPVAVKIHLPVGTDNYYLYSILGEAVDGGPVALAPKVEWMAGNAELSLGGLWMPESPWAVMTTLSTTLGGVYLFAEAVLRGNEDKRWVVLDSGSPSGVSVETRPDELFPLATAGIAWSWSDDLNRANLGVRAQYYYNGLGYDDPRILSGHELAVKTFLMAGALGVEDLVESARHYGGAVVSTSAILDSGFGVTLSWLGNLVDNSGKAGLGVSWDGWDRLMVRVDFDYRYGAEGSEFSPLGSGPTVALLLSVSGATF
ncbi:MAG: hypothetical protein A3J97_12295 [Spirochaetes bacterium RIFOXYC1_FULL_54_7]|nr:MAG: hypothetical protein A3J97_12295 [Spirochaetes bacterium RIFOXYC1_FULL_54_7]